MSTGLLDGVVPLREARVRDALAELGTFTLAVNDPPYAALASALPPAVRVVHAGSMEQADLDHLIEDEPDSACVVGLGGGSAIDTAKYIAWRTGKPLVQVPSITSVDAAFTDAIGIRDGRKVRYIGDVLPREVILDVELVRSAPRHMNRAGIGDVLSCHTGLWDWAASVRARTGVPWNDEAAALGRRLLAELREHVGAIARVDANGVRFLAGAYRRIGAACRALRHSRFEEGSEHFLAYTYEHLTSEHPLHGELIALFVFVASDLQRNAADDVRDVIAATGVRAHPLDLGVTHDAFVATLCAARDYARREGLDYSVLELEDVDATRAQALWERACTLPRR